MSTTTAEPRPVEAVLRDIDAGALLADLSQAVVDTTAAVVEHGKQGTITLTIKVKPEHDGVRLSPTLKVAPPAGERRSAFFFVADDGDLIRDNPNQLRIGEARDLDDQPAQPPREV